MYVCNSLIGRYKNEYAEAIREIEAVKSEMEAVKQKVLFVCSPRFYLPCVSAPGTVGFAC